MKNRSKTRQALSKTILLFFLLFFFGNICAQDDKTITDTLQRDTLNEVSAPLVENGEEKKVSYFQEKSLYGDMIDSMQLRQVPGADIKKMQEDDDYWYANADIKKKKISKDKNTFVPLLHRNWFQTLVWVIIICGFVGFVIWWLTGSNVGLFRKKIKNIDDTRLDEPETDDIFSINYQKEIDKAIQQSNYRLAVRLMFLRLLKDLSEKNIIQYNQGKTNFDYLQQLQPTQYYKDFFRITRNYEYSWYGQFEVGEQAYYIILDDFKNFDRLLR